MLFVPPPRRPTESLQEAAARIQEALQPEVKQRGQVLQQSISSYKSYLEPCKHPHGLTWLLEKHGDGAAVG